MGCFLSSPNSEFFNLPPTRKSPFWSMNALSEANLSFVIEPLALSICISAGKDSPWANLARVCNESRSLAAVKHVDSFLFCFRHLVMKCLQYATTRIKHPNLVVISNKNDLTGGVCLTAQTVFLISTVGISVFGVLGHLSSAFDKKDQIADCNNCSG